MLLAKLIKTLFFAVLFFGFPFLNARAQNPFGVIINEVAWMGTSIAGVESKNWWRYEWLELYNQKDESISLVGWKIELWRETLDWSLELKGIIPAKSYFLIVASDKAFENYDLNYSNLGGKLNNSGQRVVLKDGLGNITDSLDCFAYKKWFAGNNETKQTMERINPAVSGNNPSNWQASRDSGGTPKNENSKNLAPTREKATGATTTEQKVENQSGQKPLEIISPQAFPSGVVINEILPSPEGPDEKEEWIEIFNQNSFEADLSGWQITDTAGKTTAYTFPAGTKITSQGFLVLVRPETKITLNNDEDELLLIQPNGNILDRASYQKAPPGQSYNKKSDGWTWGSVLTPGSVNITSLTATQNGIVQRERAEPGKELKENQSQKQGLAAIAGQLPKTFDSLYLFLIALGLAIVSGGIIFILKKRVR